jgi:hypothetical protein
MSGLLGEMAVANRLAFNWLQAIVFTPISHVGLVNNAHNLSWQMGPAEERAKLHGPPITPAPSGRSWG